MLPTCPGRAVSTLHHSLAHLLIKFSTENAGYDRGLYQMSTGKQTKSFELFHSPQRPAVNNINFCLEMTLVSHKLSRKGDFPATNQTGSLPGLTSRLQGRREKQPPASRGEKWWRSYRQQMWMTFLTAFASLRPVCAPNHWPGKGNFKALSSFLSHKPPLSILLHCKTERSLPFERAQSKWEDLLRKRDSALQVPGERLKTS